MSYYFVLLVLMSGVGNAIEKVGVYSTREECVSEAKNAGLAPYVKNEESPAVSYLCVKATYPILSDN